MFAQRHKNPLHSEREKSHYLSKHLLGVSPSSITALKVLIPTCQSKTRDEVDLFDTFINTYNIPSLPLSWRSLERPVASHAASIEVVGIGSFNL